MDSRGSPRVHPYCQWMQSNRFRAYPCAIRCGKLQTRSTEQKDILLQKFNTCTDGRDHDHVILRLTGVFQFQPFSDGLLDPFRVRPIEPEELAFLSYSHFLSFHTYPVWLFLYLLRQLRLKASSNKISLSSNIISLSSLITISIIISIPKSNFKHFEYTKIIKNISSTNCSWIIGTKIINKRCCWWCSW